MELFTKQILKYLPIQFYFFNTKKYNKEQEIKSNFYNADTAVFPFTKPISKIINLENAPMESK